MPSATSRQGKSENKQIINRHFLSDVDVELHYNIPRKTLRNWRIFGKGPRFRKIGVSVRYDVRDVEAWMDSLPAGGAGVPTSLHRK